MYQPVMQDVMTNTVVILRWVFAVGGGLLIPHLDSANCTLQAIAFDGVYTREKVESPSGGRGFVFMEGSRVDMEMICTVSGVFTVTSLGRTLLYVNVSESTSDTGAVTVSNEDLAAIVRPAYLEDVVGNDVTIDNSFTIGFGDSGFNTSAGCGYWMGGGDDCSSQSSEMDTSTDCTYAQFNGSRGEKKEMYQDAQRFVTTRGSVNEWKIFGRLDSHPFHIHVNPMQIVSYESDGIPLEFDLDMYFLPGQFRDVLPVLSGVLTVRFRTSDFTGECIYHCHYLRHEDMGEYNINIHIHNILNVH